RWSGRAAVDAAVTVHEPAPASDPDSALAYSLEGLDSAETPAALLPRVWSPGWNSGHGLHKLQEEVNGPFRGGPAGLRLLAAAGRAQPVATAAPPRHEAHPGDFLLVAVHHAFGSDDLSMRAPAVAARAPEPYLGLNPADAGRLGIAEGDRVALWLPWLDTQAPCRLLPSLPAGVAGVPVGLPGMPFISLPARARLTRADAPAAAPGEPS
ncbi:MAG: NADH-quinone oxidoreductase subunit G, partial [Thermoleophilia bacterium]